MYLHIFALFTYIYLHIYPFIYLSIYLFIFVRSLWWLAGGLQMFAGGLRLFTGVLWSFAGGLWLFVLIFGPMHLFVAVACFSNYTLGDCL